MFLENKKFEFRVLLVKQFKKFVRYIQLSLLIIGPGRGIKALRINLYEE